MEGYNEEDEHKIDDAAVPPFLVRFEPEEAGPNKRYARKNDIENFNQNFQHGGSISTWFPRLPACR